MAVRQPRYSKEEFARRGDEIYESLVRPQVEEGNHGKIVAINIETGAFEVADDTMTATRRLRERVPDAQPWVVRIGYRAVHRFAEPERPFMMQGYVNKNCEAVIAVVVSNGTKLKSINAVIDTGFTGFLSLPTAIIAELALPWSYRDRGTLGDGSETLFDIYDAMVIWDGQYREIEINAAETEPLAEMSLLRGYRLQIDAVEDGLVKISALPNVS